MEQRVGAAIRAVRRRRGLRQSDLAREARVSTATVSRIERGHMAPLPFETTARVAARLDIRLDVIARWRGGELDHLLNAGHSAMHEQVGRLFERLPGWQTVPEASFSIRGERGIVDVLAWHATRRMLLVVELKTAIVDVQELVGTTDRKRRLARAIGAERGWPTKGAAASAWVVIADDRTNRARLAAHATVLRAAFPADGRRMRGWLRDPGAAVGVLSFMQIASPRKGMSATGGRQRIRRPRAQMAAADVAHDSGADETPGGVEGARRG